jgi:hypothetical protein
LHEIRLHNSDSWRFHHDYNNREKQEVHEQLLRAEERFPTLQEPQSPITGGEGYTEQAMKDKIQNLPGLSFPINFNQFSGYFTVSTTRNIHYWYIESSNDPSTDPVIFWTNGGPGCSGLIGLGAEFGPFLVRKDGTLTFNHNTWNQVASILYVEQPAGVGFSFFTDKNDTNIDDERVTLDNYRVIEEFLERFPERRLNDLYLASESYGGHYIPHLAKKILDENVENGSTDSRINFRGFMVGNPFVDPFSNYVTMIQMYYMHGLVAWPLYHEWEIYCTHKTNYLPHRCNYLVYAIFKQAGDRINPYALDYPVCTEYYGESGVESEKSSPSVNSSVVASETTSVPFSAQSERLMRMSGLGSNPPFLPTRDVYDPCVELHLHRYLNRNDVKQAIHIEQARKWHMCTDNFEYSLKDYNTPQMYLYKELIKRARDMDNGNFLKMMIYSGDDDSSKYP